jgi:thiol-disulfide isomerase/thioredoxin
MKAALYLLLALTLAACSGERGPPDELSGLLGRWVVINYWAEWCTPCIKEIPELNELAEQNPDLAVVGVNFDDAEGEELARQITQLGIAFPILAEDPAARLGIPRPAVLPTTLILDPEGKLANTLVGPQTLESLAAAIGRNADGE